MAAAGMQAGAAGASAASGAEAAMAQSTSSSSSYAAPPTTKTTTTTTTPDPSTSETMMAHDESPSPTSDPQSQSQSQSQSHSQSLFPDLIPLPGTRKSSSAAKIDDILEGARTRKLELDKGLDMERERDHMRQQLLLSEEQSDGRGAGRKGDLSSLSEAVDLSSADEETLILRGPGGRGGGYGGVGEGDVPPSLSSSRKGNRGGRRRNGGGGGGAAAAGPEENGGVAHDGDEEPHESWFARWVSKYGSIELENKGSVARDHLALERTFLAWLRTSLAFASIGIAITQLFRLNSSSAPRTPNAPDPFKQLRHMGKPLGATFLAISILMLSVGFHRYFEGQHWIIRGKFPASRASIVGVAAITAALMVTSLVVVLVVEPGSFES